MLLISSTYLRRQSNNTKTIHDRGGKQKKCRSALFLRTMILWSRAETSKFTHFTGIFSIKNLFWTRTTVRFERRRWRHEIVFWYLCYDLCRRAKIMLHDVPVFVPLLRGVCFLPRHKSVLGLLVVCKSTFSLPMCRRSGASVQQWTWIKTLPTRGLTMSRDTFIRMKLVRPSENLRGNRAIQYSSERKFFHWFAK